MSTIKKIHDASNSALPSFMDNEVYLDSDLGLFELIDPNNKKKLFVDVPIRNVVALGRADFWEQGNNWRDVTKHLHGTGWTDDVFEYFENEIGENNFLAPQSLGELRLLCIGGACECGNGNHRLVAAKSWLANKFGEDATLKSVKVSHYPINKIIRKLLVKAKEQNSNLYISKVDYYERKRLAVNDVEVTAYIQLSTEADRVYAWIEDELKEIPIKKTTLWEKLFSRNTQSWFDKRVKITIPQNIIDALLDDSWLSGKVA
ncbi:hypothetical protein [Marinomonas lutimaris]|uniref:hypothetical protein n=1 Tax=Marinomonas lutimaris TaxID=2846746 RepID=UPI001CA4F2CD|nr:hypothetical protein [Marinomonas lutimaris]